jgi:hypothetical protein
MLHPSRTRRNKTPSFFSSGADKCRRKEGFLTTLLSEFNSREKEALKSKTGAITKDIADKK